jgi:hypothetical protein
MRRAVIRVMANVALPWSALFFSFFGQFAPWRYAAVLAVACGFAVVILFPLRLTAEIIYRKIVNSPSDDGRRRLQNIADGLAIAIGVPTGQVIISDSSFPNVFALPTHSHGIIVAASTGAVELLTRPELEALVASQFVVAKSPWVRRASRAQIALAPALLLFLLAICVAFVGGVVAPVFFRPLDLFVSVFAWLLFLVLFAYPLTFVSLVLLTTWATYFRGADEVRDFLADSLAIQTTKNPTALVSGLRRLRPTAILLQQGLPAAAVLVDPFAVISCRGTTMRSKNRLGAAWKIPEEIANELEIRSERMSLLSQGDFSAFDNATRLEPYLAVKWNTARTSPKVRKGVTSKERILLNGSKIIRPSKRRGSSEK